MITKILNNNLHDRTDNLSNVVKALVGSWGITTANDDNVQNNYIGKSIITYIYGSNTLQNLSDNFPCLAIVVYSDGTSAIKVVPAKTTETTSKEINMAIMIAQIM